MKICKQCDGFGEIFSRPILIAGKVSSASIKCDMCNGTGKIEDIKLLWIAQGKKLKELRLSKNVSLRAAAIKLNVDASNLSKMERGIIQPKNIWLDAE